MNLTKEYLADGAKRLLADDVLAYAVLGVKREAISALCTANVDDKTAILRSQITVEVCENILRELARYTLAVPSKEETRPVV